MAITKTDLPKMKNLSTEKEMDDFLETVDDSKMGNYWNWVKKTDLEQIKEYIDVMTKGNTLKEQIAVIMLKLRKSIISNAI